MKTIKSIILILILMLLFTSIVYAVTIIDELETKNDSYSDPGVITLNQALPITITGDITTVTGVDPTDLWKLNAGSSGLITFTFNTGSFSFRLQAYNTSSYNTYDGVTATVLESVPATGSVNYTLDAAKFYGIRIYGASGLVNYSVTLSGTATLPVELSSFNAFLTNTNNVSLNWTSQSESNMVGYNVFRANSNQQSDAVKINPAIIAATNTSSEQNYSFTDHSIDAGEYYYWLQSVEANNETAFHGPVHVNYNPGTGMPDPEYQYKHFLKGAYPNPFNPSTSIQYELAEAANVEIVIFNAKGQKVRTFNQSHNNKGTYDVLWDGLDENGTSVNSGVYFYRMTAGKSVQSKKMLLVK
ncbi:MAG TPA: FlgD immunoglobulin-like domain containing protein [Candidatus Cloacimonadota bacterium]|nr:FlgD immunoglobulin-like domain containing protein [Candidatus Cloacimonadota bacterium]